MAGAGIKLFQDGLVLTAAQVNGYLMDQAVCVFDNPTERDNAFGGANEPALSEGRVCYLKDDGFGNKVIQYYNGSIWVDSEQFNVADGAITNAKVNASAAISLSKLASGTAGQIIVANSSGVPTYVTLSGDATISDSGVISIGANNVELGTDTTGNYVSIISGTTNQVTVTGSGTETASVTLSLPQNIHTAATPTFASASLTASLAAASASLSSSLAANSASFSSSISATSLSLSSSLATTNASLSSSLAAASASLSGSLAASSIGLSSSIYASSASLSSSLAASSASLSGSFISNTASLSGSLAATSASLSSSLAATSASLSSSLAATSASLSSSLAAASASLSGALTGASASFTGNVVSHAVPEAVATLTNSIDGKIVEVSSASVMLTTTGGNWINGTQFTVISTNASGTIVTVGAGTTFRAAPLNGAYNVKLRTQYSSATFIYNSTGGYWYVIGDLSST
jgi:hypothetical protein